MRAALLTLLIATSALAGETFSNQDLITLTKAGLSADVIISKITTSTTHFDTSVDALIALKAAKVDDRVIAAIITPRKNATAGLPAVRFGSVLIDLPGMRAKEGTLTIGPSGITYDAQFFGTLQMKWDDVTSICYEEAYYGALFIRAKVTGTAAGKTGTTGVVLFKYADKVMRPVYEYLKRMHPNVKEDCSDAGKDV